MSYLEPKLSCSPQRKTHKFPSFPHRTRQKELPQVGHKSIPVHKLDINRLYNCQIGETMFDKWAFVPTQPHKISPNKSNSPESTDKDKIKSFDFRAQQQFQTTSQLFLKRYLKRKEKKIQAQTVYYKQFLTQKQKISDKRKSFVFDKTSKSFSQITSNTKKLSIQPKTEQNWPQIIVKSVKQNYKNQNNRRKFYTDIQQQNNCYDFYLQKYLESNYQKDTEKQVINKMQKNQHQENKNKEPIKFKIMKKYHKIVQQSLPSEYNADI